MLTKTVNLANISHLIATFVKEFAQLGIHIKIHFVSQIVYPDLETMDLVVVFLKVLLLVAHSHIFINKDHVSQHVVLDHIQMLPPESVKLAAQIVSRVCQVLFVLVVVLALT